MKNVTLFKKGNVIVFKLEDKEVGEVPMPDDDILKKMVEGAELLKVTPRKEFPGFSLDKEASKEAAALILLYKMSA